MFGLSTPYIAFKLIQGYHELYNNTGISKHSHTQIFQFTHINIRSNLLLWLLNLINKNRNSRNNQLQQTASNNKPVQNRDVPSLLQFIKK